MEEAIFNLAGRLFLRGLLFRYLKWRGKPGRPQALSLEITHDCIARCVMCNIWKIPRNVPNLPIEDWIRFLSSELFGDLRELDITGGEPFLRKDLPHLFSGICDLKLSSLKQLKSIALTTNGLLTDRVLDHTENALPKLMDKGLELVMVCALDGIGETHDKIRNVKQAWLKVRKTIEGLTILREKFPNLQLGVKTTVLPANMGELEKIVDFAQAKALFTIISPCIITAGRYLNTNLADDLLFSDEDKVTLSRFYQSHKSGWSYHTDSLIRYLKKGTMMKPCSCGFNYFFVRSNGDVLLCPLINVIHGNIKEQAVEDLFQSKKASTFRRNIGRYAQCRKCTEPGLERYALPFEGLSYLFLLMKMGRKKFLQMHYLMGLNKYLD
jgi:MoaA/NifB/PqqE/SkfB family radical SAM enzyme